MATLKINGKEITVKDGTVILEAARKAGFYIPTFCYQADLIGGGLCRMCLVEIEGHPKLEPSCIVPVRDGMSVLTETAQVNRARADMLEFLLANHGLDCPVCDKGGECELQDLVYQYGPHKGRYAEEKYRWHEKDYVISPVIIKNSNRCVQCMKCVRVCREVVGQNVLDGLYRGDKQEETSFFRGMMDCDQDGNCIEVCPVGCFMRLPWRYRSRPWDQKTADTICPYCGTGCRMVIEERDGKVNRSRAQLGVGINSETLCARGRFGYDLIHHPKRLTTPLLKIDGRLEPAPWEEALDAASRHLKTSDPSKTGGIASARLTNEELFLFQKLFREVLGSPNLDSSTRWDSKAAKGFIFAAGMTEGGVSIFDCMKADTVFIVGTHLSDENPVTDYMVRRMARENRTAVVIASPRAMKLDSTAGLSVRHLPGTERELLDALSLSIGREIDGALSGHPGWDSIRESRIEPLLEHAGLESDTLDRMAERIASSSIGILAGTEFLRFPQGIASLATLIHASKTLGKKVSVVPVLDRCNQRGAWEMGVLPGLGPGYRSEMQTGLACQQMLEAAERGELESLYLVGEDPAATHPDEAFVKRALSNVKFLVVQDLFFTETAKLADCVLPGACFGEKEGTFTNQEGRVQSITRLMKPPGQAKSDLVIIGEIGRRLESGFAPKTRRFLPVFQEIRKAVGMYQEVSLAFVNRRNEMNDLDNRAALTKDSGIRMTVKPFGPADAPPQGKAGGDERDLFTLITGNHLLHSGRLSTRSDILRLLLKDLVVEISDEDAASLGLSSGEKVRVTGKRHQAVLTLKTKRGSKNGVAFIAENFEEIAVNRFFEEGGFTAQVRIARA